MFIDVLVVFFLPLHRRLNDMKVLGHRMELMHRMVLVHMMVPHMIEVHNFRMVLVLH